MATVTVNSDFRITLPRLALDALKLKPGNKVDVKVHECSLMELRKVKRKHCMMNERTDGASAL